MTQARCRCVALTGVSGQVVEVEAHLGGMPGFSIGGLPDSTVMQARDRVRAAVLSSNQPFPTQRITVNLSPAALPKTGTHFDLALAIAILAAGAVVPAAEVADTVFLAELGLDGRLRAVRGVLPAVAAAAQAGVARVVVASANAAEARLADSVRVLGARSLSQVVALLRDEPAPDDPVEPDSDLRSDRLVPVVQPPLDLADVVGQTLARRALEVSAAGAHHLFLHGPPGAGKTMLAARLPGLLPDLELAEALEVSAIHSVAGVLPPGDPLIRRPPFADPHHTASPVSLVGGGSPLRPGAISLAHRGVLFLDEANEFSPAVLDALRQPLEAGSVLVSRARSTARFPARFLLVLAANPCPCGYHGVAGRACACPADRVRRYGLRISGPVRDRLDLSCQVAAVSASEFGPAMAAGEASNAVAARVADARARQARRLRDTPWRVNGEVPGPQIRRIMPVASEASAPVAVAMSRGRLSARGAARVLRVAWTIADLAGRASPARRDVDTAILHHTGGLITAQGAA